MGGEKDASRGGFFQLFDWTAKSRKKLFSSKSDIPERSKQGKKSHGNLPMTRLHLVDEDDVGAGSSIKGGSDYSCASSVTDEEGYGSKAPGVVARLMGLDSLPTSNFSDPYSTPFFDTQSLKDVHYRRRNLDYLCDHQMAHSGNLLNKVESLDRNPVEPKPQKIISKPIEKFQTEVLPPKSAKSIPVTQYKLLSPIKSHGYIPTNNAAHIMEAAARIIEPRPHAPMKGKMSLVGSSSAPIKVRDLKEKVEATQRMHVFGGSTSGPLKVQELKERVEATHKPSKPAEASRRIVESSTAKYLKGQSPNKSWNGSAETTSIKPSLDSEEASSNSKNKGRSISLAIQAKVNVQKREGMHTSGNRSFGGHKDDREVKSSQPFKSQPSVQKNLQKKSSTQNASNVLRQNNQKQNSLVGKDKLLSKPLVSSSQGRRVQSGDPCGRPKTASKTTGSSRTGSRKLGLGDTDNEKEVLYSGMKNHPRKKRSIDGEFNFEKSRAVENGLMDKSRKPIQSNNVMDRHFSWAEDSRNKGMDVVSFTFTAPLTRSIPGSEATATSHIAQKSNGLRTEYKGKYALQDSDSMKISSLGYNVIGGDALSVLLEQKLKELSYGVESSRHDSIKFESAPCTELNIPALNVSNTTSRLHDEKDQHTPHTDKLSYRCDTEFSCTEPVLGFRQKFQFQGTDMMDDRTSNHMEAKKFFDYRHPSPVSVLETCPSTESCNYSDSVDSNSTEGSKPTSSSIQGQEILGSRSSIKFHPAEPELSDSASSTSSNGAVARKYGTMLIGTNESELEYVNEILFNVDLMFEDLSLGRVQTIINPRLFDQLESRKVGLGRGDDGRVQRKVLFDCVSECLELRCRRHVGGGREAWIKGVKMVERKERLAEQVYKEICGWRGVRIGVGMEEECKVDELVDKDMSSQYGRWLDLDYQADAFEIGVEIQAQIFNTLVEEAFADMYFCNPKVRL